MKSGVCHIVGVENATFEIWSVFGKIPQKYIKLFFSNVSRNPVCERFRYRVYHKQNVFFNIEIKSILTPERKTDGTT